MKYLLMIYNSPEIWQSIPEAERTVLMTEAEAIMKELAASGEWVSGQALASPGESRTIRVREGAPAITDGPFLEAKEHLAGFCIIDCATAERATEIATRWPDARYTAVEIRPIIDSIEEPE